MFLLTLIAHLIFAGTSSQQDCSFCSVFGLCDTQVGKGASIKRAFLPRVDSAETKTHYIVTIEIPGIAVKDVKVETENRNLYVSGEKKQEIENKDQKHHCQECRYGEFKRELALPEDALTDGIQAKCKDSVLTITIPRKPSDRKTIPIQ